MPREQTSFELKVRNILSANKTYFFIALCLVTFLLAFIEKQYVFDEIAAIQFMEGPQKVVFQIFKGLELIAVPLSLALQFTVVGFVLWVGCFLWGYRVNYYQCWKIAMIASTVFFIPKILTILWFTLVEGDATYWDVEAFYPLSLMNLFDHEFIADNYHIAYKSLNVFQVIYWFVLITGIDLAARKRKSIAQAIVFTSYVPLFLFYLWFMTVASQ